MPRVHVATFGPLEYIAGRMRVADYEEFAAVREDMDPSAIAQSLLHVSVVAYVVHANDGEPVAAIGAARFTNHVASMWAYGTDRWSEVILSLTKHAIRVMVPELTQRGFHRAEARALASRDDVAKWVGLIGLKHECRLVGFGSEREDFALYAWTDRDQVL